MNLTEREEKIINEAIKIILRVADDFDDCPWAMTGNKTCMSTYFEDGKQVCEEINDDDHSRKTCWKRYILKRVEGQ